MRVFFCTSYCFEESLANRALVLFRHRGTPVSHRALDSFLTDFCRNSPPGYCDYDRVPVEMKEQLLGQLRTGKIHESVAGPEREWVAHFTHQRCPEYSAPTFKLPGGRFLKIKHAGHIWFIHPNDRDPWPSNPHAHDYEERQKLHLGSGAIFSLPKRNLIGNLRAKDLIRLREELSRKQPGLELPPLVA